MTDRTLAGGLQVATCLHAFLAEEALPAAGIDPAGFWDGVARIIEDLTPVNRALLARRDELQAAIDDWHRAHAGQPLDVAEYRAFLTGTGYLADDPGPFQVAAVNVDREISSLAGPQLVVPVSNARFAINAANARWGSLYDALYGTDVISEDFGATRHGSYNPVRGQRVIDTVRDFLDEAVPLAGASHRDVIAYVVSDGSLLAQTAAGFATLADPAAFAGYAGSPDAPSGVLLRHHGLHVEILIDRAGTIGSGDPAGVQDVLVEAALTTIVDFEDSVAAVDSADKVAAYRNWLGLSTGELIAPVEKGGTSFTRRLARDRAYTGADGSALTLPGRSLLLVRNVGHLMTTDAVLDADGAEVFEGILDAIVTTLAALPGSASQPAGASQPAAASRRPAAQQPHGLGLHREAEAARAGRGGLHRGAVRPGGITARAGPQHDQARPDGRGAAHLAEPCRLHPGGEGPDLLHQHWLPGPLGRRDPHFHGGRPAGPQGRHEIAAVDPRLRGR